MSNGGHGGGHVGGHAGGGHHGHHGGGDNSGAGFVGAGRRRHRFTAARVLFSVLFGLAMAFGSLYLGQLLHH